MIGHAHRFHGYNSLRYVYRRGTAVRGPECLLKVVAQPRRSSYRAAVVVSKKACKSAVGRNRIRRRIYEQLRLQLPAATKADIVVVLFDDRFATMAPDAVAATVRTLLSKAALV